MIGMGIWELILIILIVMVTSPVYFLPLIVAIYRGHASKTAIGVLNLLLGWSGIAWVVVLVWAFSGERQR